MSTVKTKIKDLIEIIEEKLALQAQINAYLKHKKYGK
jgi:hypothetical protein